MPQLRTAMVSVNVPDAWTSEGAEEGITTEQMWADLRTDLEAAMNYVFRHSSVKPPQWSWEEWLSEPEPLP